MYIEHMKILAALFLILSLALPVHAEQTLTFGYIGAPLSYSSLSVLKAAYEKIGINAKGLKLPAARALASSDAGLTDGEVHRIQSIEKQHPQLIRIKVPINKVEGMALSCGKAIDTSSVEAIRNYRIGIKIGTRYAEKMTEGMPSVTALTHEDKLVKLLLGNRLDIIIGDRPWAETLIEYPDQNCLRINEPPLVVTPLYHYLHRRHAKLVPHITLFLKELQQIG